MLGIETDVVLPDQTVGNPEEPHVQVFLFDFLAGPAPFDYSGERIDVHGMQFCLRFSIESRNAVLFVFLQQ